MRKITKLFAFTLFAGAMVSCSSEDSPMTQNDKVAVLFYRWHQRKHPCR